VPGPGEDAPARQPVTVPPSIDCRCGVVVPEQHQTPLAPPVADVGPCMGDGPVPPAVSEQMPVTRGLAAAKDEPMTR
jgi:hypothetical protein